MTKVMEILHGYCHREYDRYETAEEARKHFSAEITFIDVPDWVGMGFRYVPENEGDERFIVPELEEGWAFDKDGNPWQPELSRSNERRMLHDATMADELEALRALRSGDTSMDWQVWLDAIDAYNLAVDDTVNQEGYPDDVEYPEYPTKPITKEETDMKMENGGGGS